MRRKRSSRGWPPVSSRTMRSTTIPLGVVVVHAAPLPPSRPAARGASAPSRPRARRRRSRARPAVATSCASSSGRSPGSFRCSETSVAPPTSQDADVVHLAHARDTLSAAACARSRMRRVVLLRLDVDDDVAARQRALHRLLDRVRRRVALPDGRARRHADHDVRELPRRRLPHPQPPELDRRVEPAIAARRRLLGVRRGAVHQHVDVRAHQPRGRDEHEHRDEERGDGVGAVVAGPRDEHEPDQHRDRAGEVAGEVERVRLRARRCGSRRDARQETTVRPRRRRSRSRSRRTRTTRRRPAVRPGRTSCVIARQAMKQLASDEDRRLAERREMLGLPVAVLVAGVRRPNRDTDGEERQQRRDEVGPGVQPPRRSGRGCASRARCRA